MQNPPELGESKQMAKARFLQNERKMQKKGVLVPFNKEMLSYVEMKHAEIIPGGVLDTGKYYLPMLQNQRINDRWISMVLYRWECSANNSEIL